MYMCMYIYMYCMFVPVVNYMYVYMHNNTMANIII